tara:strand:- start:277 stop:432 length:156 start_codon:yes stop_codon:yes gene_type:complete
MERPDDAITTARDKHLAIEDRLNRVVAQLWDVGQMAKTDPASLEDAFLLSR